MALQCPQCSQAIEADFGVVTCPKCQSVLFIDMEGQIQLSDSAASNSNFAEPPSTGFQTASEPPADSFQDSWMQDQEPVDPPASLAQDEALPFDSVTYEEPIQEEAAPEVESHLDLSSQGEPGPEVYAEDAFETTEAPARKENDLSDVSEFSNSDQAYGPLSYSVTIEQIDTKEIRQQLLDALSDPKFQWDERELLKKIKMGKLRLENLNPVKASVLVHRLQAVPVKVSWTQNVFS